MSGQWFTRRQVLAGLASASVYGVAAPLSRAFQTQHMPEETRVTPGQALQRLIAGNERYANGKAERPNQSPARRKELAAEQSPFATIVGCSDSRLSPELVFDQGLGDLFVVRVAGNVVDTDVAASVQYAVEHLHTPLVLVLGHEKCGAVTAALAPQSTREKEPAEIQALLNRIEPALKNIDPHLGEERRVAAAVEANARQSMETLAALPTIAGAIADKRLRVLAAVYELGTGKVNFLR